MCWQAPDAPACAWRPPGGGGEHRDASRPVCRAGGRRPGVPVTVAPYILKYCILNFHTMLAQNLKTSPKAPNITVLVVTTADNMITYGISRPSGIISTVRPY
jgi:hypothetical protein